MQMRTPLCLIAVLNLIGNPFPLFAGRMDSAAVKRIETGLRRLVVMHGEVSSIHPYLGRLHPVAVLDDDMLLVFDVDTSRVQYKLAQKTPLPFPMSPGIRASFPLAEYANKPVCVVSPEVFDSTKELCTIFHEFVHCSQYATCEQRLKARLEIVRQSMERREYSWEINHGFPYADPHFVWTYGNLLQALAVNDTAAVHMNRRDLRSSLSAVDYEYMVWEEWKEGLARYLENEIRARFGIEPNAGGNKPPYDRVLFYYGGEMLIRFTAKGSQGMPIDAEALFDLIFRDGEEG